jgi:hypothetical protein
LKSAGISTYCSIEPILPDKRSNPIEVVDALKNYVDLFELGKWNPKKGTTSTVEQLLKTSYNENYFIKVMEDVDNHCKQNGINYCHAGHSRKFLEENGIQFIPSPTVTIRGEK